MKKRVSVAFLSAAICVLTFAVLFFRNGGNPGPISSAPETDAKEEFSGPGRFPAGSGMIPAKPVPSAAAGIRSVAVPAVGESELSGAIDKITGAEEEPGHHLEREKMARALGRSLPVGGIERLMSYMRLHSDPSLTLPEYAALRNEIANILRIQREPVPHLAEELGLMYHDKAHDPVWRDYCIQHLGLMRNPEARTARDQTIRAVLSDSRNTAAGTALIALSRIPDPPEDMDSGAIALWFLSDPAAPDSVKATSLQIAVTDFPADTAKYAREILADRDAGIIQKVSAIAALRKINAPEDVPLLRRLAESHDPRIAKAAKSD